MNGDEVCAGSASVGTSYRSSCFSSSACSDCPLARRTLADALGEQGFLELSWEDDPGAFDRLGVDAVPATLVVAADGSGTLWPGGAEMALESLGP